ncbi:MAG: hypothetical protein M3Y27_21890 [Acidobacteriota bacterium]|nr:hypothetical protein [Acidobacteriota bacterium]
MNEAMVLEHRGIATAPGLGELLAQIGLPSKRSPKRLSGTAEGLFKGITAVLDELLLRAIDKRTKADFVASRTAIFVDYVKAVRALSDLVKMTIPDSVVAGLVSESFSELETDLREEGTLRFGSAAKDQAIFTIWTLRKISSMISMIVKSGKVPDDLKEADQELATKFGFSAMWSQFHLDCLVASIRSDKQIQLEVLSEIRDGLRSAVNAYGLIREAVGLRIPRTEPNIDSYVWDDEDQELLNTSMREMETAEILDGSAPWSEQEATAINRHRSIVADKPKPVTIYQETSPAFGTHIREGIEIIKDWIENPKSKQ